MGDEQLVPEVVARGGVVSTPAGLEPRAPAVSDDFGLDPSFTERLLPAAEWLYRHYWRVETEGVENVPAAGRALLAANHGGVVPYDGAMIRTAILLEHPAPRPARMFVPGWPLSLPFVSELLLKTGNVLAHPDNALALLEREELVGVFPEGGRGAGRPFQLRYRLGRFGRGGFVRAAVRAGAPIVPVAVVGAGEAHPVLFDLGGLGRSLGLPSLPVPASPVPLPAKWLIAFGPQLDTAGYGAGAADDPGLVMELGDEVRDWIQAAVDRMLSRRATIFY
ncbi:MAG: acyltransferase family protein [Candidatus Dormibacteraeota bacterium]|nr:acyltransferase family protein [Candidatus Dormibacteraeota bacterium]